MNSTQTARWLLSITLLRWTASSVFSPTLKGIQHQPTCSEPHPPVPSRCGGPQLRGIAASGRRMDPTRQANGSWSQASTGGSLRHGPFWSFYGCKDI